MKFTYFPKSIRQLSRHLFAIAIAVLLSINIWVLPSQAESVLIAQTSASPAPIASRSFVTAAVNRVGSAVVRIDTERTISRNLPEPFMEDPFFRRFFGDSLPKNLPPEQLRGLGSGFIIDKSGLVLTNAHVVDKADKVTVRLKDGRKFEGKVQGADEVTDLAVVKINAGSDLPVAPLGSSSNVQVGDWAIAVGNPLGFDNTVTLGIVSTLKRPSAQVGISSKRLEFIQTDAAINPGNSGGPLLNELGEVIGINTAIRADATGIGFAIPIDKAKQITSELQRNGKVAHPFIGIGMDDLTPEEARRINANPNSPVKVPEVKGILVGRVIPNSPAANAGIRVGDVIVAVDGKSISTGEELLIIVENSGVGENLQLKVQRGNRTQQISLRTAELKDFS
ncbi:HhoA/HhoB/HtrA family serine endopeptidase [Rivularia sp. UHCC 0363]|uniref:HhoA/HhoB/HtrA family serine endopeptidase n=1 Tax=Rivularia sp. UHCC 0363 TaxID=3110244 RepID=UPI002B1F05F8|nr:HhoA/HhoB/HtrA family serine endopeptidase [Rivularia sp. UHCC 0363]MEA5593094.1 HhoA/HhoB/HtrA family serine endopeptidase [Rivularia sp. UHCC 0363]